MVIHVVAQNAQIGTWYRPLPQRWPVMALSRCPSVVVCKKVTFGRSLSVRLGRVRYRDIGWTCGASWAVIEHLLVCPDHYVRSPLTAGLSPE